MPSGSNVPCCLFGAIKNRWKIIQRNALKKTAPAPCEIAIIPNCDHFYVGAEEKVAKIVTDWLTRTLG